MSVINIMVPNIKIKYFKFVRYDSFQDEHSFSEKNYLHF